MEFPNYDRRIRGILPHYDSFHQETINLVKSMRLEPELWLDTGCGTGNLAERALKHFPNTSFILADPSAEMLKEARKKLFGSSRITFLEPVCTQELSSRGLKNLDIITAIQSHHYLSTDDRIRATIVCRDLLNEDGIYIAFENIRPMTDLGTAAGKMNWKRFQLSAGRDPETVEGHLKRFDTMFFPLTVEEHLSMLRGIGFRAVELLWYSCMQAGFYCVK
jgi:tRNA (cmo5U34)-methyltransferase